jgi:general L-amino acid transport system permease protein
MKNKDRHVVVKEFSRFQNYSFRMIFYQITFLLTILGTGYWLTSNIIKNMIQRGISSGFGFMIKESGFDISETIPLPLIEGRGLFIVILSLAYVLGFIFVYWRAHSKGEKISPRANKVLIAAFFLIGVLGSLFYLMGDSIAWIGFSQVSSYSFAILTGVLNTLKLAFAGCITATIVGLMVGIGRLSPNWLLKRLSGIYVETFRNIPILLQILFWYFIVIGVLPSVRQSINFYDMFFLNNRGAYFPMVNPCEGFRPFMLVLVLTIISICFMGRYKKKKIELEGKEFKIFYPSLFIFAGLSLFSIMVFGTPISLSYPVLKGFNFQGGLVLSPEFVAMFLGLVIYTSAYVAEIVRSGIQAISKGQIEAGLALGLKRGQLLRLVVLPQSLRVIIPPLTGQYLSLAKDTSLGVAVAYPELASVSGTIMAVSGQVVEVLALTMSVYLTISLLISLFMNWYNTQITMEER